VCINKNAWGKGKNRLAERDELHVDDTFLSCCVWSCNLHHVCWTLSCGSSMYEMRNEYLSLVNEPNSHGWDVVMTDAQLSYERKKVIGLVHTSRTRGIGCK